MTRSLFVGLACLLGACASQRTSAPGPATPPAGDDLVVLEAEQGTGDWTIVPHPTSSGGRHINDPGAGSMTYTVTFPKAGRWYLFLRAWRGQATPATDDENDVFVRVQGEKLWAMDDATRPDGMRVRCVDSCWSFLPKGPGPHTPPAIKMGNVHAVIDRPGRYTLELRHRSTNLSIDKILFKHESLADARALPEDLSTVANAR
jgi:hypothetical protein